MKTILLKFEIQFIVHLTRVPKIVDAVILLFKIMLKPDYDI